MMRRERQSFLDLRCGYGQKLALGGDFYGTSYHGHVGWRMAENNNNTSTKPLRALQELDASSAADVM
jgi:hypothetical protein